MPFRLDFEADPEANVSRTFRCASPTRQDFTSVLTLRVSVTSLLASSLHLKLREGQPAASLLALNTHCNITVLAMTWGCRLASRLQS